MAEKFITKTLTIEGMTCANCENIIERALKNKNGIVRVKVNYSKGNAIVTFNARIIDLPEIERVIEKLDYKIIKAVRKVNSKMMTASAVLVVILGLFMFSNGMTLSGFALFSGSNANSNSDDSSNVATAEIVDGTQVVTTTPSAIDYGPAGISTSNSDDSSNVATAEIADGTQGVTTTPPTTSNVDSNSDASSNVANDEIIASTQVVTTTLSSRGYEPINVQVGIPVKWIIKADASSITGCNNTIIIPEYNIEKSLEPGDNIIEFTPKESGTVPFSCWMGMIRSQIFVYDNIDD